MFEKHGDTGLPLYVVWTGMNSRCYKKHNIDWHNYGGRDITVCLIWRHSYIAFKKWALENGYDPTLQLDRKDNNGHYCPSNCRWTTRRVNSNNTRSTRRITAFGETKPLTEWESDPRYKVKYNCLYKRLSRRWKPERAMTQPELLYNKGQTHV